MKKMCFAVVLLALLFFGSLWNMRHLGGFVGELRTHAATSRTLFEAGEPEAAADTLHTAIDLWQLSGNYTQIFLRHAELSDVTDAFYELLGDLYAGEEARVASSFEKLDAHLVGLIAVERITFANVF